MVSNVNFSFDKMWEIIIVINSILDGIGALMHAYM